MRDAVPRVLVITDRVQVGHDRGLLDVVAAALGGGADGVLLRERDLPEREHRALLAAVGRLCAAHEAALLVSYPPPRLPRADGSAVTRAHADDIYGDGVQLRRGEPVPPGVEGRRVLVGRSCHDLTELRGACEDGLDYVTLSPVAPTRSKPGYGPVLGAEGFTRLVRAIRSEHGATPRILALGGVDASNAGDWVRAGADGVAVMGEVMRARDPRATTQAIVTAVAMARRLAS